jgi:hypothetical protein
MPALQKRCESRCEMRWRCLKSRQDAGATKSATKALREPLRNEVAVVEEPAGCRRYEKRYRRRYERQDAGRVPALRKRYKRLYERQDAGRMPALQIGAAK